jgi:hypothetical protein
MNPYTLAADSAAVLTVTFSEVRSGWEQWVLLSSDRHHDNPHCDRDLETAHLQQAIEREALIVDAGDLFCAMQGKYDPRSNMDDIRPDDVGADYLDRITSHAAEDFGAYAANWLLLGKGNHETNILKRHGHDLTSKLAYLLNREHGGKVHVGGYGGWIKFVFADSDRVRCSLNFKYHHGAGGGGPVTRGVIQTNRQAVYLPDADVVLNGHTHDAWHVPIARERLTSRGMVRRDLVHFVRTPGYKDEYGDGGGGYHNENWRPPKPIGAMWMRMSARRSAEANKDLVIDLSFQLAVT